MVPPAISSGEMVPPLDIYHLPSGAVVSSEQYSRRRSQHLIHRRLDPNNAQFPLEFGPESAFDVPIPQTVTPQTSVPHLSQAETLLSEDAMKNSTIQQQVPRLTPNIRQNRMSNGYRIRPPSMDMGTYPVFEMGSTLYNYHSGYHTLPHRLHRNRSQYDQRVMAQPHGQYSTQDKYANQPQQERVSLDPRGTIQETVKNSLESKTENAARLTEPNTKLSNSNNERQNYKISTNL